jgi:Family of unknown function (DUF6444)
VAIYEERIAQLEARVNDFENRLKLNSTNLSKPSSADPIGIKRKPALHAASENAVGK